MTVEEKIKKFFENNDIKNSAEFYAVTDDPSEICNLIEEIANEHKLWNTPSGAEAENEDQD
jgi:hypothetical protein